MIALWSSGREDEADALSLEAFELARSRGNVTYTTWFAGTRIVVLYHEGAWDEATALGDELPRGCAGKPGKPGAVPVHPRHDRARSWRPGRGESASRARRTGHDVLDRPSAAIADRPPRASSSQRWRAVSTTFSASPSGGSTCCSSSGPTRPPRRSSGRPWTARRGGREGRRGSPGSWSRSTRARPLGAHRRSRRSSPGQGHARITPGRT